jgi:enamine deaminase RidA (YjgF/YER057c/UK114 family)
MSSPHEMIRVPEWPSPKGYENGVRVRAGSDLLFIAGQVAWNEKEEIVGGDDFAAQFRQALSNVVAVVAAAGGRPEHLVRLTMFVKSKDAYSAAAREIGAAYRDIVGRHFPAMSLIEIADLLEEGALLEIEGTAALPAAD